MECLENIIQLEPNCANLTNDTLYSITDLQGIDWGVLDSAVTKEHKNGYELLKRKRYLAVKHVIDDMHKFISTKVDTNKVLKPSIISHEFTNKTVNNTGGNIGYGYEIDLRCLPYACFRLNSVCLKFNRPTNISIKVFDLYNNTILYESENIETQDVGAISYFDINKLFSSQCNAGSHLFVYFVSEDDGFIPFTNNPIGGGCCGKQNKNLLGGSIKPKMTTQINSPKIQTLTDLSGRGMSLNFNIECCLEAWICSIKNFLALPILYKFGSLVVKELQYSKRLNSIIQVYQADHKKLADEFDSIYEDKMTSLFDTIKLPQSICFRCKNTIGNSIKLP